MSRGLETIRACLGKAVKEIQEQLDDGVFSEPIRERIELAISITPEEVHRHLLDSSASSDTQEDRIRMLLHDRIEQAMRSLLKGFSVEALAYRKLLDRIMAD